MKNAPIPKSEKEILASVKSLNILNTEPEERFDKITKQAIKKLKVPISTITIIDENREWFKSCQGLDFRESDRTVSLCGHTIVDETVLIVEDTLKDERFINNPMVTGVPYIRSYARITLFNRKDKMPVGVFV